MAGDEGSSSDGEVRGNESDHEEDVPSSAQNDVDEEGALRGLPVCTSGVASTSRAWLRSRPRAIFEAIERETAAAHHGEAGHYMERLMAAAYGPLPASPVPLPQSSTSIGKRPLLRSV